MVWRYILDHRLQRAFVSLLGLVSLSSCGVSESVELDVAPLDCLESVAAPSLGGVGRHDIVTEITGRLTFGDLNGDGQADFVVANRDRLAAYDLCGRQLWRRSADTNWDFQEHSFWNMTSFGYIGDADGDGSSEFLHIGSDWRTLYLRDGNSGVLKKSLPLDPENWMFVLLARRPGESGETATRVVVATSPYHRDLHLAAYDLRGESPVREWYYVGTQSQLGPFSYALPQAANLDAEPGDEILYATVALDQQGSELWSYSTSSMALGGMHMLTVKDIDPSSRGLESVISLYGPGKKQPSLVSYSNGSRPNENWRAYSPHRETHPHQHTVGDFDIQSPGLETLARHANGFDHWMVDYRGKVLRKEWRVDPGWHRAGEYVQGIEWDDQAGTEVLYIERHAAYGHKPRMAVVSPHSNQPLTPVFSGGRQDSTPWLGRVRKGAYNPFEAASHPVDLFGDGREEILTWGSNKISIFYNASPAKTPRRWGDPDYMQLKKLFSGMYNPR